MKKFLIFLTLFFIVQLAKAQDFEVPENVQLKSKEDFVKYEKDVIAAVNWLDKTPIDQNKEKRKEVNSFLMKWIEGSPTVSIEIRPNVMKIAEKNGELLMTYMGGYTRSAIEKNSKEKATLAAYQTVVNYYKAGNGLSKNKFIDKLVKLDEEQKLEDFVKKENK